MPRLSAIRALATAGILASLSLSSTPSAISPDGGPEDLLREATFVFERAVDERAAAIPLSVLLRARAIAVFPHAVKQEARYSGEGIMSARGATPNYWTPPAVLEFEGAIPLDLESRNVDFIFVAQTARGLDYMIQDRFVSPVIIPIAPGAIGYDTPVRIDADLLAYMHFADYFAGVTVDDWMISQSKAGNALLYGRPYSTDDIVHGSGFFHLPPAARSWRNALMACFREMS
jgi:lipid-binding SYLF domain-containing protein